MVRVSAIKCPSVTARNFALTGNWGPGDNPFLRKAAAPNDDQLVIVKCGSGGIAKMQASIWAPELWRLAGSWMHKLGMASTVSSSPGRGQVYDNKPPTNGMLP
jgi:hypothetical protein